MSGRRWRWLMALTPPVIRYGKTRAPRSSLFGLLFKSNRSKQRLCNEAKSVCNNSELRQHPCRIYIVDRKVCRRAVPQVCHPAACTKVLQMWGNGCIHYLLTQHWVNHRNTNKKQTKQPRSPDQIATIVRACVRVCTRACGCVMK